MFKQIGVFIIIILSAFSIALEAEKLTELPEINKPTNIAMDQSRLYIPERSTVYIYRLKDYKLIAKIGREGQGPQEFQTLPHVPVNIDVSTGKLVISSMRKLSYFTKKGKFLEEFKTINLALTLKRFGDGFLGRSQARDKEGVLYNTVNIYDAKLNKIREIYRLKDSYQGRGRGYKILGSVFAYQAYENNILLPGEKDNQIDVFDKNLNKRFTIQLDQDRRKVDDKFRKKMLHYLKTSPETKDAYQVIKPIIFPDYFPVVADFFVDNDTIYVLTWKRENQTNEFFTYDITGKFKKRLVLPVRYETDLRPYPMVIIKGKMYQLVENENEIWELHRFNID